MSAWRERYTCYTLALVDAALTLIVAQGPAEAVDGIVHDECLATCMRKDAAREPSALTDFATNERKYKRSHCTIETEDEHQSKK